MLATCLLVSIWSYDASAGFLQLLNRNQPSYFNGSSDKDLGYTSIIGSDSQFQSHTLSSTKYTITLWIQSTVSISTDTTILLIQQSGITTASGLPGARVPAISMNQMMQVTGCIDSSESLDNWLSISDFTVAYTWKHVFISVDGIQKELQVWSSTWRGSTFCDIQKFDGDPLTFEYESTVYIGGSPYSTGITGKVADVRYYGSTSHSENSAQALALNRRCDESCWHSCWGPDVTSCSGFEFLDPHYSRYFANNDVLNDGYVEFKCKDLKFKGHELGLVELSASGWIYADLDAQTLSQAWWFLETGNGYRLCAFLNQTNLAAQTATSIDTYTWALSFNNVANKWVHIGLSISQTTKEFICCITVWDEASQWNTVAVTGDVLPITTDGMFYIGNHDVASGNASIGGRLVDVRFFPSRAFSTDELKEIPSRVIWAFSCNGQCWGPDTFSCDEYIQIVDPRFSNSYTNAVGDYTVFEGDDPRTSHYNFVGQDFSTAFWFKLDDALPPLGTLMKVHDYANNCGDPGTCQPMVYLTQTSPGTIQADVIVDDSGSAAEVRSDTISELLTGTQSWWHIVFGVSSADQNITVCWTKFSLSSPTTTWNSEPNSNGAIAWDPAVKNASIWVGDDEGLPPLQFQGKIVDARYYPATYLSEKMVQDIVSSVACVGDTEDCTGPDNTSVAYIRLTEKNYEYITYSGTAEGVSYFYMLGTHINFLNHPFGSRNYQVSAWIQAEERLDDTSFIRFQRESGAQTAGGSFKPRQIPYLRYTTDILQLKADAETQGATEYASDLDISANTPSFKKQFNVYGSVWNDQSMYSWFAEWGKMANWDSSNIQGATDIHKFDSTGWAYVGGDEYESNIHQRISNALYYPNSCEPDAYPIMSKMSSQFCDVSCNNSWYGPGILSWKFLEPLYLSDEWEPFIGDGTAWVTLRGYDDEFDGRFMGNTQYSICTWFYLNQIGDASETLYLIVMTSTQDQIEAVYNEQAPAMIIQGDKIYGQLVTAGAASGTHTTLIEDLLIETWYYACVVVDQSTYSLTLHLGTFDGVTSSDTATFTDEDVGYFSSDGYLYYGGIQIGSKDLSIDGEMLDIRYWDTYSLNSAEITDLISNKGCHKRWDGCTGPTSCDCQACLSPYCLVDGCCTKDNCPQDPVVQNPQAAVNDCGVTWEDQHCTQELQCMQCKQPNFRLLNQWYTSCDGKYYESTTTVPDYQWLACHTSWGTWTGPGQEDWTGCAQNWYQQPDSTSCLESCPWGYVAENTTCQTCDSFSGYSGILGNPIGNAVETVCKPIWGDGEIKPGEECDDGNVIDGDGCSSLCLIVPLWATVEEWTAPKATLIEDSRDVHTYSILLYFDKPVVMEEPLSVEGDMDNNIESWDLSIEETITLDTEKRFLETDDEIYNAYQITLKLLDDVLEDTFFTLTIKTKIADQFGKELADYTLTIELSTNDLMLQVEKMIRAGQISTTAAIGVAAVTGLASAGGAVGAGAGAGAGATAGSSGAGSSSTSAHGHLTNPATFWRFIEILQIVNYMLYLAAECPDVLNQLYKMLSLVNGDFMPAVFPYFVVSSGIDPPSPFAKNGVSSNFFLNAGSFIQMIVINFLMLGFFIVASKFLPRVNYFQTMVKSLWLAAPLRIAVEGVIDIICACAIQLRNHDDDTIQNFFGTLAAIVMIAVYVGIIYVLFTKVIWQNSEVLEDEDHQNKYGAFYEAYWTSHWIYKSFYLVEAVRRVLFVIFLVFFADHRYTQIYACIILQFVFLLICAIVRPLNSTGQNLSKIAMEIILLFAFILIAILDSDLEQSEDERAITQWVLFGLIASLVLSFALYVLICGIFDLVLTIFNALKKCCKKGDYRVAAVEDQDSGQSNRSLVDSIQAIKVSETDDSPIKILNEQESQNEQESLVNEQCSHGRLFEATDKVSE